MPLPPEGRNPTPRIDRAIHWVAIKGFLKDILSNLLSFAAASRDFSLQVSLGNIPGYSKVNKFGHAVDCDLNTDTDVWDGADGTTSTDIWVMPTQARAHTLASTSGNDVPAGTGMRTCRLYGLLSWDTAEVSEDLDADGTTTNEYVIIHRIKGLTYGSGGANAGVITATAATDGTVTAAILAGESQTQMAIYGIPSGKCLELKQIRADVLRSSPAAVAVDVNLLQIIRPGDSDGGTIHKEHFQMTGDSPLRRDYDIPKSLPGPCIVKIHVNSSANDSSVTASFDGYVVDDGA